MDRRQRVVPSIVFLAEDEIGRGKIFVVVSQYHRRSLKVGEKLMEIFILALIPISQFTNNIVM